MTSKIQDWRDKANYLYSLYNPVSPIDYYAAIGLDDVGSNSICVMRSAAEKGNRYQRYTDMMTLLQDNAMRCDAYIYPALYYKSYPRESLLRSVSCIYIDLDNVSAADLRRLCDHDYYGYRPTYIVNSGNGVHLVYAFSAQQQTYNWVKNNLKEIHKALLARYRDMGYAADLGTGLSHAYRIVGSRTKLGQICTAYKVGTTTTARALAQSVGVAWQRPHIRRAKRSAIRLASGLYNHTKAGIINSTTKGHRYMSLFAMACIGYKCHIDPDQIAADLLVVAEAIGLPAHEATHAFDACDPDKAITVKAATLEEWLGWQFARRTKRNGRSRKAHLSMVAAHRTQTTRNKIWQYLHNNPMATIAQIAAAVGISRKTVSKYCHAMRQSIMALRYSYTRRHRANTGFFDDGKFIAYILPLLRGLVPVRPFCPSKWFSGRGEIKEKSKRAIELLSFWGSS